MKSNKEMLAKLEKAERALASMNRSIDELASILTRERERVDEAKADYVTALTCGLASGHITMSDYVNLLPDPKS